MMNDLLVALFRSLFGFVSWVAILLCVVFGGLIVYTGTMAPAFIGWSLLIGGPIVIISMAGTVALMIQNNDLLRRIAEHEAPMTPENRSPAKSAGSMPARREPSLRSKADQ
jgi:hypothetical protein